MKLFIIAGEPSGDLHGGNLVREIKRLAPSSTFQGFGGENLEKAGVKIIRSLDFLNYMGLIEVIQNLGNIRQNFKICKNALMDDRPDALILIDYPGFNLRMAKWAKKQGIPVLFYISPQVWAWKESRIKQMKANIDRLIVILPFEKAYFQNHGLSVDYVGHPLLDVIDTSKRDSKIRTENVIALLPGSRKQEIRHILPAMLAMQDRFPDHHFYIGKAPGTSASFYQTEFNLGRVKIWEDGTYALLSRAKAALVGSGTATLETALFKVPQVVCYKSDGLFVSIVRRIIKVKYISLVNLILDKPTVTELIQHELNPNTITKELTKLLDDSLFLDQMKNDYDDLWEKLGSGGASERAAKLIVDHINNS